MLALSDSQLRAVWAAADGLPVEKRGIFLGRLVAELQLRAAPASALPMLTTRCAWPV